MRSTSRTPATVLCSLLLWCSCHSVEDNVPDQPEDDVLQTTDLVHRLADQWIAAEDPVGYYWDWMDAVYMLGFTRAYGETDDADHLAYPIAWVDSYYSEIEDHYPDASDRVAPNIVAVEIMRLRGEDLYTDIPPMVDDYLATAPRSADGAILHWGTQFPEWEDLLIDSLFMFGGYLVAMYHYSGDVSYLDLFAEQLGLFADRCRDPDEGLFLHAWDDAEGVNVPSDPIYWGRGNGWIVAVTAWYLAVAPSDHAGRPLVEDIHVGVVDGFKRYQDSGGLFHTVLNVPDDPDNYLETSCTALFAFGVATSLESGALAEDDYRPSLVAAIEGIQTQLVEGEDGHLTLQGTSFGTMPTTYDSYIGIPLVDDLEMGIGTVLMALAAADGM